jgi:hypothetical protein
MSRQRKPYPQRDGQRLVGGFVGVVFMLAGISVGVQAFYIDPRLRFLDKVGTVTTGEVKSSDFYSGRGGRKYNVSFRFVDAQGISQEGNSAYPSQDGNRLGPGTQISVTYLADDPQQNYLTQPLRKRIADRRPMQEMSFILIFIIFGCLLLWKSARPTLSDERNSAG